MTKINFSVLTWDAPLNAFEGFKESDKVLVSVTVKVAELDNAVVTLTANVNRFEFNLLIGSRRHWYKCSAKVERINGVICISNIHKVNDVNTLFKNYLGI